MENAAERLRVVTSQTRVADFEKEATEREDQGPSA